ncbi:hypothetical protein [Streptomyces sp. BP-8]|uniref:Uncharacterized protein n=1 Tax=Streptomyces sirii TaxID=3127701 RepID=A0ABZ2QGT9_9ACTN
MENHEGSDELITQYTASLRDACEDMQTKRQLFTPYGRLLLDEMCQWADRENQQREARVPSVGLVLAAALACLAVLGLWAGLVAFLSYAVG